MVWPGFAGSHCFCGVEAEIDMTKKGLFWISFLIIALLLPGCSRQPAEFQIYAMDTVMTVKLWGSGGEVAGQDLARLFQEQEEQLSVTRPDSLTSRLNEGQTVALTGPMQTLLQETLHLSRRTGGALDPCLYSVTKLWGFTTGHYRVPEQEELEQALQHTGAEQLMLHGSGACLAHGAQIDLGAVGKGWAARLAVESLAEREDITGGILSIGGNVQTYGEKPDGTPWQIGIQDPEGAGTAGMLSVTGNWAVVTSGGYQRYFVEDGVRYCHIIDPDTGMPAQTGLASVTVVAEDGLLADGLSTALYVMGLERAAAFWRDSGDFEAVFLTEDGMVYATEGIAGQLSGCTFEVIGS